MYSSPKHQIKLASQSTPYPLLGDLYTHCIPVINSTRHKSIHLETRILWHITGIIMIFQFMCYEPGERIRYNNNKTYLVLIGSFCLSRARSSPGLMRKIGQNALLINSKTCFHKLEQNLAFFKMYLEVENATIVRALLFISLLVSSVLSTTLEKNGVGLGGIYV